MKSHVQVALVIAAVLYLAWGVSLLVAPEWSHLVISSEPFDPTTTALFGAGLFAFVIVFFIAAHRPERETVHAAVTGLLLIGVVAAYQMFVSRSMPQSSWTVLSLVIDLSIAFYLLMALTETAMALEEKKSPPTARRTKARRPKRRR